MMQPPTQAYVFIICLKKLVMKKVLPFDLYLFSVTNSSKVDVCFQGIRFWLQNMVAGDQQALLLPFHCKLSDKPWAYNKSRTTLENSIQIACDLHGIISVHGMLVYIYRIYTDPVQFKICSGTVKYMWCEQATHYPIKLHWDLLTKLCQHSAVWQHSKCQCCANHAICFQTILHATSERVKCASKHGRRSTMSVT